MWKSATSWLTSKRPPQGLFKQIEQQSHLGSPLFLGLRQHYPTRIVVTFASSIESIGLQYEYQKPATVFFQTWQAGKSPETKTKWSTSFMGHIIWLIYGYYMANNNLVDGFNLPL